MSNCDETIWSVCGEKFCSFRRKHLNKVFCENRYNATGLCNRVSCPLANGNYGTVLEIEGKLVLYIKTAERAHLPSKLWERIVLPSKLSEAISVIDNHMVNIYKPHQILRCKQRLLRLRQIIKKSRELELGKKSNLSFESRKTRKRETNREMKALKAAQIPNMIEEKLLNRLKNGVYEGVYNYDPVAFQNMLNENENESENENENDSNFEFEEDDDDDQELNFENFENESLDDDDDQIEIEGFVATDDVDQYLEKLIIQNEKQKRSRKRMRYEDDEDEALNLALA